MSEETLREGGYEAKHFELLAPIEDRYFWFAARRSLIADLSRTLTARLKPGYRVLEFGCGGGNVLSAMRQACPHGLVFGMDLFREGLMFAKSRGNDNLIQADAFHPPFRQTFDLVGAFDVVEHLSDDVSILEKLRTILNPGGHLLLTVPAYPWLWSDFDRISHHCRRYTESELRTKIAAAGFEVVYLSPYMATILPMVWLHRKLWSRPGQLNSDGRAEDSMLKSEIRIVPVVNTILRMVLRLESALVASRVRFPFGTSFVAIARRKD